MKDPFTIELLQRARKTLGTEIKGSIVRDIEIGFFLIISLTQVYYFVQGYWHSLFTMPFTWWVFGVNIFHDASHFSWSKNWRINSLGMNVGFMFSIPYVWYHQHIIAHHSFPNIPGFDPDLYHSPEITRLSPDIEHTPPHIW
jgi:fatty acid desaturase